VTNNRFGWKKGFILPEKAEERAARDACSGQRSWGCLLAGGV